MQIIIPKQVEEILAGLRADGYEAFAVGGCVRDTLLGRVPGTGISPHPPGRSRSKRCLGRQSIQGFSMEL